MLTVLTAILSTVGVLKGVAIAVPCIGLVFLLIFVVPRMIRKNTFVEDMPEARRWVTKEGWDDYHVYFDEYDDDY